MPRHKYVTHCLKTNGPISQHCSCPHCTLSVCDVCGGYEGSLTSDCPGERLSFERQAEIHQGKLDYVDGVGWHARRGRVQPCFESREPPHRELAVEGAPVVTDQVATHEHAVAVCAIAWARAERVCEDRYAALLRAESEADAYLKDRQNLNEARASELLAQLENEKIHARLADQREQECHERLREAARRLADVANLEGPIVHVLRCGHAVCNFTSDPPRKWPAGHMWTRIEMLEEDATCPRCLAIVREATKDDPR